MIIHVRINIPQEARRDDTHPAKSDTDQIHPLVALRKRNLACSHHNFPRRLIARYTWYQSDFIQEGGPGEGDGGLNRFWVCDAELEFHGPADVVDGVGGEFVDEDIEVGCVADGAADDADGEGEGCDGGD